MKFLDEYRDPDMAAEYIRKIRMLATRHWQIMETCGGQTHTIVRFGIDQLLSDQLTLVHGPGCPVCVTPLELIEKALNIAARPEVIFCSFGDMLRVPGEKRDLLSVKANGAEVRILYSPLDAIQIARENPTREVVFFAVGFETTAPANALAVYLAAREMLDNFSVLVAHVLVPPAIEAIMSSPENRVDGFLAAGHVCSIMGYIEYEPISMGYGVPIVVTGFEPIDILQGLAMCVRQLEEGRFEVENQYRRSVRRLGSPSGQDLISKVFRVVPRKWRGLGEIPRSGLGLRPEFSKFDAESRFGLAEETLAEPTECQSGQILRGLIKPPECPAFGKLCTPEHPLGATMVSSEGACAAYFRYRRGIDHDEEK